MKKTLLSLFSLIALVLGVSSVNFVAAEDTQNNTDYDTQIQLFMTYQIIKNPTITQFCKGELYTKSFDEFVIDSLSTTSQEQTQCPKIEKIMGKEGKTFGKRVDKNFTNENADLEKIISKEMKSIEKKTAKTNNLSKKTSLEVYKTFIHSFIFGMMIDEGYKSLVSKSATEQATLCGKHVSDLKTCAAIITYKAGAK